MSSKIKKVVILIIIATTYSSFLMSSSLRVGNAYEMVEQREIVEVDTTIPKLYLEGDITNMTKQLGERKIKVKFVSENNIFEKYATVKVQGSSSVAYDKKNYTIKFYNDENYTDKFKVDLGWGREHKYVIKANWIDKTHSRNIVAAKIAAEVQSKYKLFENTPNNGLIDGYPIDVYLNGEFYGLYTMNIPKDEWLYNMDKNNENHIVMIGEQHLPTTAFKEEANFKDWECQVGAQTTVTLKKFNRLVNFIMNSSDEDFRENLSQYINIDAAINYYILVQLLYLSDNYGKNLVMATYDGKIWYPTLYDLDTAFGVAFNGRSEYPTDSIIDLEANLLFERLSDNFSDEIASRYFELREIVLTEENIISEIDNFYNSIPPESFEREKQKWGTDIPGYDIEQMKTFIKNRLPVVDEFMKDKCTKQPLCINNSKIYCQLINEETQKRHAF